MQDTAGCGQEVGGFAQKLASFTALKGLPGVEGSGLPLVTGSAVEVAGQFDSYNFALHVAFDSPALDRLRRRAHCQHLSFDLADLKETTEENRCRKLKLQVRMLLFRPSFDIDFVIGIVLFIINLHNGSVE